MSYPILFIFNSSDFHDKISKEKKFEYKEEETPFKIIRLVIHIAVPGLDDDDRSLLSSEIVNHRLHIFLIWHVLLRMFTYLS